MHQTDPGATLRHQRIAGGQQRHGEGVAQAVNDDHNPHLVLLRGIKYVCRLGQRNGFDA